MSWLLTSIKKARSSLTETVRKLSNNEMMAAELRQELEFVQAATLGTANFGESVAVLEDWTRKLQNDDDRYDEDHDKFSLCTFREIFFSCGALEVAVISVYTNRRECFDFGSTNHEQFTQKFRELLHLCFIEFIADWEPLFSLFFRSADDFQECLVTLVRMFSPGRSVIHCSDVASLVHREIDELLPLLPPAAGDPEIQSLALKKHAELCAALVEISERLHSAKTALREHRKSLLAEFRSALTTWTGNQKIQSERSRERLAEITQSLDLLKAQTHAEIDQIAIKLGEADAQMEALKKQASEVKAAMVEIETDIAKQAERKSEAKRKLASAVEANNEAEISRNLAIQKNRSLIDAHLARQELRHTELEAVSKFQELLRAQVPSRIPRAREIACEAIRDFFQQAIVLLGGDGLGRTATKAETSEIARALEEFQVFESDGSVKAVADKVRELLLV